MTPMSESHTETENRSGIETLGSLSAARRADDTLTLDPHDRQIAESLGIRTREELVAAVEAMEKYLAALSDVRASDHRLEASGD